MHYMAKVRCLVYCFFLFLFSFKLVSHFLPLYLFICIYFLQTVAMMATFIKRYKYCKQVKTNNLDRLAKARNDYLVFKDDAIDDCWPREEAVVVRGRPLEPG